MDDLNPGKEGKASEAKAKPERVEETTSNNDVSTKEPEGKPAGGMDVDSVFSAYGEDKQSLAKAVLDVTHGAQKANEAVKTEKARRREEASDFLDRDKSYITKLYGRDPQLAEELAQEKWGKPYGQVEEEIFKKKEKDGGVTEKEKIDRLVDMAIREKLNANESVRREKTTLELKQEFIQLNKLNENDRLKFEDKYKFLVGDRSLNEDDALVMMADAFTSVFNKTPFEHERQNVLANKMLNIASSRLSAKKPHESKGRTHLTEAEIKVIRKCGNDPTDPKVLAQYGIKQ